MGINNGLRADDLKNCKIGSVLEIRVDMSAIQDIEKAVYSLLPEYLAEFRAWFEEFDAQIWDRQFEKDVQSGRLDRIASQALEDFEGEAFKEI